MDKHTSAFSQLASWLFVTFGAMTAQELGIYIGIATSIGTFAVNWWYKRKEAGLVRKEYY